VSAPEILNEAEVRWMRQAIESALRSRHATQRARLMRGRPAAPEHAKRIEFLDAMKRKLEVQR